jgi:hypothetical protein
MASSQASTLCRHLRSKATIPKMRTNDPAADGKSKESYGRR